MGPWAQGPSAQGPSAQGPGPWPRAHGPWPMAQSLKWGKTHFVPKWCKLKNSETQNRYLASPNDRELNLLSNGPIESFWGTLWLELWPFLCFIVESRRIACRCLQTKCGAICYRMSVSRASGTPCGSSYGRFCILMQNLVETH